MGKSYTGTAILCRTKHWVEDFYWIAPMDDRWAGLSSTPGGDLSLLLQLDQILLPTHLWFLSSPKPPAEWSNILRDDKSIWVLIVDNRLHPGYILSLNTDA